MRNILLRFSALTLAWVFMSPAARAVPIPVGIMSYDATSTGAAQFDILNFTGPNGSIFPDTTFPVTTSIHLTNLSLTVEFSTGPNVVFDSSYFTLSADGLSFDGSPRSTLSGSPTGLADATGATLTGLFSPTSFTLNDGSVVSVDSAFTATMSDITGLKDGDFAEIDGTPGSGPPPSPIPEPGTWSLVGTGVAVLATMRRKLSVAKASASKQSWLTRTGTALGLCCLTALIPFHAQAQTASVHLNAWTAPSTGASGSTFVNVVGTGFPSGSISPGSVNLTLSTTCGGSPTAAPVHSALHLIGTAERFDFEIPPLLATGTYFVSLTGTTSTGNHFASSNCSEVQVTHTSTTLAACLPSSSLAVLSGVHVTAYVPNGSWGTGTTGVQVVPIEGGGAPASIPTPHEVNSCSSNSQTGQTVCVANNTDVYEITGSTLTRTLSSGSNAAAGFSGGSCENCGVSINALTNTAVISMGIAGSLSGDGVQLLNLTNNTFASPFPTVERVSENQSVDPSRNLILSPGESNNYDLLKINTDGSLSEFSNQISTSGEFDSAAEDCTTGIALSTLEFTGDLYITDLTQALFTPPSGGHTNGTWTAPGQVVNFPEFGGFSAGTDGISVAAGTTHLGIVSGEFGGSSFGVFQLPSTSGTGTPSFVDYAAASLPPTPDGRSFSAGFDPHTITAYTSPNDGRAYGLIADWFTGVPTYVAIIDLQKLLSAPRTGVTHNVMPTYDLLTNGVVRYVATH
ncbi:MAG TPA: PEP-CTERM sorting domain-containing protein [Edaphobacter sp.]